MTYFGALPRVFGVLLTRNSADILRLNVVHHLARGHCERIIVIDNGSSDETRQILRRLARRFPLTWTSVSGALHQPEYVTAMAHEAFAAGADWVIPLDTDEFWHAEMRIPEFLVHYHEAGIVLAPRIEFIQARDQARSTSCGVLRATMRVPDPLEGEGPVKDFIAGRRSLFELRPIEKGLVRAAREVSINRGAHSVENAAGPSLVEPKITVFHVPLRSRATLEQRAEHGRRIAEVSSDPTISYQNRFWQQIAETGRQDEGWRAHSYADGALDVGGRRVELVEDLRLVELLAPVVGGSFRRAATRLVGR
jgi:hypothetical protein